MDPGPIRAHFLGAGASKADRFPLTSELKYGVAAAMLLEPQRFAELSTHLLYLYDVRAEHLREAADYWEGLKRFSLDRPRGTGPLPEVTDLLSTLDWMIREHGSFGPGTLPASNQELSASGQLAQVRDLVVQALCESLGDYLRLDSAATTRAFLELVRPQDCLITTNWDLLLDAARDARFGTLSEDYGCFGNVVLTNAKTPSSPGPRPVLLKLHGSLSWLYCQRCQRLVVNPRQHIAGDRTASGICECTARFCELIVTPGFVREYRNVHLLNIWSQAMLKLAAAGTWVFVGYSLPPDDIGIRTLLLKARRMRLDLGLPPPAVTVVTGTDGREQVLTRYRSILPSAQLHEADFAAYVKDPDSAAVR